MHDLHNLLEMWNELRAAWEQCKYCEGTGRIGLAQQEGCPECEGDGKRKFRININLADYDPWQPLIFPDVEPPEEPL